MYGCFYIVCIEYPLVALLIYQLPIDPLPRQWIARAAVHKIEIYNPVNAIINSKSIIRELSLQNYIYLCRSYVIVRNYSKIFIIRVITRYGNAWMSDKKMN